MKFRKFIVDMALLSFAGLAVLSCNAKRDTSPKEMQSDSLRLVAQNAFESNLSRQLKDTIAGGSKLTFESLPKESYDSLWRGELNFEIPLEDPGSTVQIAGNCFIVKYRNGKEDSFCNQDGIDGNSGYSIRGSWKGLILINDAGVQGGDDFFVSLSDGTRYDLNGTHLLSPDEKRLILYTDANQNTLTNDFFVNRMHPAAIENIVHYEFAEATVADAAWIADNQCLLLLAQLQENENDPVIRAYYLMTVQ
ncbi:MAG TPA: hypothetical protein VG737_02220 [Cyclobacteriaceae bacterium]|nr:hypothetical protein [Cyclobacteriaceae bacterium]